MDSLLKSDIFFFITGAVVLTAGILVTIILFYAIRIAKDVQKISTTVQKETENIIGDIAAVRTTVKEKGTEAIASFFGGAKRAKTTRKKKAE